MEALRPKESPKTLHTSCRVAYVDFLSAVLKRLDKVDIDELANNLGCSLDLAAIRDAAFRQKCIGKNETESDRFLLLALSEQLTVVDTSKLGIVSDVPGETQESSGLRSN